MELFLALAALAVTACVIVFVIAVVGFIRKAIFWTVFFPIRLLFKVVGWVLGAGLAVLLLPVLLVIVAVAVIGAILMAILSLLAPLLPVAFVALVGWGIYRYSTSKGLASRGPGVTVSWD